MGKETDLEAVKRVTKSLTNVRPKPAGDEILSMFAIHPFIHDMFWYEKMYNDNSQNTKDYSFEKPEIFSAWKEDFCKKVDKCSNLARLYMFWQDPWKMTFMKLCGDFLSEKDFAEYLAESWTTEENPNMDVNVSREASLEMFRKAKKHYLMEKEDLEHWKNLPEEVELWRGVSKGRIDLGLSWTDDKSKAEWFMQRFKELRDGKMKLLKVVAPREHCIAYFDTRGEKEILLDVFAVQDQIKDIS